MSKFEAIRQEIKRLSQEQKILKPQRKQYRYDGIRTTVNPQHDIIKNKYELRHLFQAYALIKGVERSKVTKPSLYNGVVLNENYIQELVKKYSFAIN